MIHLKKRLQAGEDGQIRLAFLQSDFAVPHGQLWDCFASLQQHQVPEEFRVGKERDIAVGAGEAAVQAEDELVEWMEPYDALGATFCQHRCAKLVQSYSKWEEIRDDLVSDRELPYNMLWAGNWLFEAVGTYEEGEPRDQRGRMEEAVRLMDEASTRRGICVFPPLQYVLCFARKVRYLMQLGAIRTLPVHLVVPPTVPIDLNDRRWKRLVMSVRSLYDVDRVLLKREVSGRGNHVFAVNSEQKIPNMPEGTLEWMVQPYSSAFDVRREMRMYVVRGVCRWGVATRKADAKDVPCEAVAPGMPGWDQCGGVEAAGAAEAFAREYCKSLGNPSWLCDTITGNVWFLRVDMVSLDGDYRVWMLNELEFFGNADLHFECMENASELFQDLQSTINAWIGTCFCQFKGLPVIQELHKAPVSHYLENETNQEVVDLAALMRAEQLLMQRREESGLLYPREGDHQDVAATLFVENEALDLTGMYLAESQKREAMQQASRERSLDGDLMRPARNRNEATALTDREKDELVGALHPDREKTLALMAKQKKRRRGFSDGKKRSGSAPSSPASSPIFLSLPNPNLWQQQLQEQRRQHHPKSSVAEPPEPRTSSAHKKLKSDKPKSEVKARGETAPAEASDGSCKSVRLEKRSGGEGEEGVWGEQVIEEVLDRDPEVHVIDAEEEAEREKSREEQRKESRLEAAALEKKKEEERRKRRERDAKRKLRLAKEKEDALVAKNGSEAKEGDAEKGQKKGEKKKKGEPEKKEKDEEANKEEKKQAPQKTKKKSAPKKPEAKKKSEAVAENAPVEAVADAKPRKGDKPKAARRRNQERQEKKRAPTGEAQEEAVKSPAKKSKPEEQPVKKAVGGADKKVGVAKEKKDNSSVKREEKKKGNEKSNGNNKKKAAADKKKVAVKTGKAEKPGKIDAEKPEKSAAKDGKSNGKNGAKKASKSAAKEDEKSRKDAKAVKQDAVKKNGKSGSGAKGKAAVAPKQAAASKHAAAPKQIVAPKQAANGKKGASQSPRKVDAKRGKVESAAERPSAAKKAKSVASQDSHASKAAAAAAEKRRLSARLSGPPSPKPPAGERSYFFLDPDPEPRRKKQNV